MTALLPPGSGSRVPLSGGARPLGSRLWHLAPAASPSRAGAARGPAWHSNFQKLGRSLSRKLRFHGSYIRESRRGVPRLILGTPIFITPSLSGDWGGGAGCQGSGWAEVAAGAGGAPGKPWDRYVTRVCLLCSPHCGRGQDSRPWPLALGATLPAASDQQSARDRAAAPTPRGTLDLHWVRPWGHLDLEPLGWETAP